jgi:N6-adenosine-specific RNA methylase IME4
MKIHPAADLLPMMPVDELQVLADSIRANGQLHPVTLLGDMVLDGRNRLAACRLAGVTPRTVQFTGDSPVAFVIAANAVRRQMTASQKACFAAEVEPLFAEEAKARQQKHGGTAPGKPANTSGNSALSVPPASVSVPTPTASPVVVSPPPVTAPAKPAPQARDLAAATVGTSGRYVGEAKALKAAAPTVFAAVKAGTLTLSAATREMKRAAAVQHLQAVETIEARAVAGVYDVLVIDPPWPMQKIDRDCRPNQVEFDYPTMDEPALAALAIPTADNCHVWVWTTHRFLPMAFRLLTAWRLSYVCTFVWHKPGGFQPVGLPQFNCEFVLYARRGSPSFIETKALPTCFTADRAGHSVKPEEFYAMVRRVTAGRRLDMFGRRVIEGFESWGKEAPL